MSVLSTLKICTKCKVEKDLSKFYIRKDTKCGLSSHCKSCFKVAQDRRYQNKKEEYSKYYQDRKDQKKKEARERYWKNTEKCKQRMKQWRLENRNYLLQYDKERYLKNREARLEDAKKRLQENRGKFYATRALRRIAKILRTPKWLTNEQKQFISAIYEKSCLISKETGVEQHVDHIIPLQGESVSGLHVPWNLQIIPAIDNLKKTNSFLIEE